MNNAKLEGSIINATKWSSITELIAKIVLPVTNMVLARILTPEAFGVVATVSMIISFAEMLSDAGFQKYLIQHEFEDDETKTNSITVAFWTNLGVSLLLWGIIIVFCDSISSIVGNPGLGRVITISGIQLPLTAFSSIQIALYKRDFDYKTLFRARMVSVSLPFIITIPLALIGFSYWALIIGTICSHFSNAILLTYKSKWKPSLFFDIELLKEMVSFSFWSLVESISVWLTTWIDALIIGNALSSYYLGLYKTSVNMVNALMTIVTASFLPILFSLLSRLQNDDDLFKSAFYICQGTVAYLLFPIGLGLYIYSDVATQIMLGQQWTEASFIIGIWGLTSVIKIVLSDFNSECYRAKGMPKLSFFLQVNHLVFLIPTCLVALSFGFSVLIYSRALIRFQLIATSLFCMQYFLHIPIKDIMKHVLKPAILSIVMGVAALILRQIYNSLIWNFLSIFVCSILYGAMVHVYARGELEWIYDMFKTSKLNKKLILNR